MMEASCSRFTAAEGGARLAMAANDKNILAVEYSSFIATRLIHEDAYKIRGSLFDGSQRSIYVTRASRVACVSYELKIMTDLKVVGVVNVDDVYDWCAEMEKKEVLVCTSSVLKHILKEETLSMENINILIIDSCHLIWRDENLQYIMKIYKESDKDKRPRILALTYPLFTSNKNDFDKNDKTLNEAKDNEEIKNTKDESQITETGITETEITETEVTKTEITETKVTKTEITITDEAVENELDLYENLDDYEMYEKLEWKIEELEKELCCEMDLAEDIDSGKRLSYTLAKPKELVIEYSEALPPDVLPDHYKELETFMRATVTDALGFIDEHRYDPTEIYGEDLYEEFKNIPDPTIEPKDIFKQFLYVLDQLGPYAADKAAFTLLSKLEKLKIKVPYERHFILLCLCTTVFVKIRCYADLMFSKFESDWDKIKIFSTPKVLRFAEILIKFQPPDLLKTAGENTTKMLSDLEKCDFVTLGNKLEDKVNTFVANLKDLDDYSYINREKSSFNETKTKSDLISNENSAETKLSSEIDLNNANTFTNFEISVIDNVNSLHSNQFETNNVESEIVCLKDSIVVNDKTFSSETKIETNVAKEDEIYTIDNLVNSETKTDVNNLPIEGETCTKDNIVSDKIDLGTKIDAKSVHKEDEMCIKDNISSETKTDVNNLPIEGEICTKDNIVNEKIDSGTKIDAESVHKEDEMYTKDDIISSEPKTDVKNVSIEGEICTKDNIVSDEIDSGNKIDAKGVNKEDEMCTKDDIISSETKTNVKNVPVEGEICTKDNIVSDKIYSGTKIDVKSVPIEGEICTKDDTLSDNINSETKIDANSVLLDSRVFIRSDVRSVSDNIVGVRGRRVGGRARGRGRAARGGVNRMQLLQQNPDALCGIVFMKEALMAKIMFMLIVDMCRAQPLLSYLCAQYCALDAVPAPGTEPRDTQRHGKKHEEVLKKFRMHECNLLLATSALEEGIDLPRCNLVLRWDLPPSYRSYGLSRCRARASRASCVVLCSSAGVTPSNLVQQLCTYRQLDQIISRKCGCGIQNEPPESEENAADTYTLVIKPYTPLLADKNTSNYNPKSNIHKVDNTKKDSSDKVENCLENVTEDFKVNTSLLTDRNTSNNNPKSNIHKVDNTKKNSNDIVENCLESNVPENIKLYTSLLTDKNTSKSNPKSNTDKVVNTMTVLSNVVENCLEPVHNVIEKPNLKVNENIKELEKDIDCTEFNGKCDNDISNVSSDKSVNIVCNKCNQIRVSDSVECSCLVQSVVGVSRTDSKVERDKKSGDCDIASVDLSTAIALINRYCGKLPSDTFTRLAPQWWLEEVQLPVPGSEDTRTAYVCTLRLPLNCPVKYNIVGHPMPSRVLARRMVALQACRILHKSGELDNQLMPIGKENFKAAELDNSLGCNNDSNDASDAARPGTTKRRQYYFKKTAWAFTDCQPVIDCTDAEIDAPKEGNTEPGIKGTKRNMLYAIVSKLWCALPERYNTRGRRLHAPQHASQAIGILMAKENNADLQIPAFPVYTRSGEVRVCVERVLDADARLSPRRARLVRRFMRFVFAEVLRVRRRGMKLCSEGSTHNNYYIVPTVRSILEDGSIKTDIDWSFLELIYQHTEEKKHSELEKPVLWNQDEDEFEEPDEKVEKQKEKDGRVKEMENPILKPGEEFVFDAEKYKEAVVTPWYRNQDQPQFFLVAEICWNLTPDSAFPSAAHSSFRAYYLHKYGAKLTQAQQPLLDVDHTSARLNLLTPRYVNRKGVALPVSSERTRRAKRDRLDQKQILVPELCKVHPFAAPLWFATVALPCVLYRINALLIADEIRRAVAIEVGLGVANIQDACPGFQWPPLDFGWSLAEVLSADSEKSEKRKDEDDTKKEDGQKEIEEEHIETEDIEKKPEEPPREKTINDILQEKEDAESGFEIGTWSNDMASSIPEEDEYDEFMEPLPSNLTFCTSASGGANWCEPIEKPKSQFNPSRTFSMAESDCSYMSSDFDTDDSDLNSESDEDTESSGFWSKGSLGVRIEYKTAHEAEAVDVERKKKINPAPQADEADDQADRLIHHQCIREGEAPKEYIEKFRASVTQHKTEIMKEGNLIPKDKPITDILPETKDHRQHTHLAIDKKVLENLFPFGDEELKTVNGQITLESIEKNKRILLNKLKSKLPKEDVKKMNCFSMVDVDIDSPSYVNEKVVNVGFDTKECYVDRISGWDSVKEFRPYYQDGRGHGKEFDFDHQPILEGHPGPSPSVILQALTMSNANDGINLERLETIGDSFLKFAITAYLYCAHPTVHEGKLSHMRSKQVSNLNLYRLGRARRLGARMTASKFEPHDNWLPPCHRPPHTQHAKDQNQEPNPTPTDGPVDGSGCFIPYNLITQHSIPDKSIADCVEALIGAYLLECGPRGALLFMSWLGIRVLPRHELPLPRNHPYVVAEESRVEKKPTPLPPKPPLLTTDSESSCSDEESPWQQQEELAPGDDWGWPGRPVGSLRPYRNEHGDWVQAIFGELRAPPSPLLRYIADPEGELERMLSGYDALENTLQYRFRDRSLLLQALTHASHQTNRLTDCYQRLEFLGDAVLDYLITRHLYEDARRHSPGALTDLRSALVNNTIFATLAARHGFHKYFRHMSPGLDEVLTKYVKIQEENGHSISEEHYLIQEDEMEQAEDVEVPKALGDLFESVAGAIFLDSGMCVGAVWKSYVRLMGAELEAFSAAAPKSPVRELLEAEPDTAKFGKPERLADGRRVRVCVEVFGRGAFKGVGRNYRIAKGTAARCALRHLRIHRAR